MKGQTTKRSNRKTENRQIKQQTIRQAKDRKIGADRNSSI